MYIIYLGSQGPPEDIWVAMVEWICDNVQGEAKACHWEPAFWLEFSAVIPAFWLEFSDYTEVLHFLLRFPEYVKCVEEHTMTQLDDDQTYFVNLDEVSIPTWSGTIMPWLLENVGDRFSTDELVEQARDMNRDMVPFWLEFEDLADATHFRLRFSECTGAIETS